MTKTEKILDIDVTTLDYSQLIDEIDKIIINNEKANIIAVNPEKFIAMEKNYELKKLISEATFKIPDGIGVILASKINGGKIRTRITGVDLFLKILELANLKQYRVFLYGGKEEVVSKTKEVINNKFPDIKLVGYCNGYEKNQELILKKINDSNAQIVFVALGSPKQEFWIQENMKQLSANIFQGVGGSFDVLSGSVKRAPAIFRKAGLEWFYRLISQPSRFRRQLALPKFLFQIILRSNK